MKNKIIWIILVAIALPALWCGWKRHSIHQEEVEFKSGNLVIRGTLLSPRFGIKAPGVVLVHGSGQTSRKSTMLYAWIFASQGYAALSYDKRGVGKSDGGENEWREFSLNDLAADAAAGYRFLESRTNIDSKCIGFFGASQGGWVVSIAANQVESPAFLIMVSASVSTIAEDRIYGREAQIRHAGFGEDDIKKAIELIRMDHQVTRTGKDFEKLSATFERYREAAWFRGSGERWADDVCIKGARLKKGKDTWSEPFVMVDVPDLPDINPAMFIDPRERLWLTWYTVIANQWSTSLLKYLISENYMQDNGPPEWPWNDAIHVKPGDPEERGILPNDRFVKSVERKVEEHAGYLAEQGASEKLLERWKKVAHCMLSTVIIT